MSTGYFMQIKQAFPKFYGSAVLPYKLAILFGPCCTGQVLAKAFPMASGIRRALSRYLTLAAKKG